uniref:Uncharacterized protein n=1 Tax=Rhizophora mucronata TaxID=61149 RepID=A0A2P2R4U2_RHIMU
MMSFCTLRISSGMLLLLWLCSLSSLSFQCS